MHRIWVLSYLSLIGLVLVKTSPNEVHSESFLGDESALRSKSNIAEALLTKTTTTASNLFFKVITTTRPPVTIRQVVTKSKSKDRVKIRYLRKLRTYYKHQSKNNKKSRRSPAKANGKQEHSPHKSLHDKGLQGKAVAFPKSNQTDPISGGKQKSNGTIFLEAKSLSLKELSEQNSLASKSYADLPSAS
ncbi:uncharacterized protein LOC6544653 [Drosophila erecta]|uniref:Uncharacterized protein n=1 Tax=Drosophila erecta TaxID=7220 RepID=B3NEH9_DROER|nr:uncharacterized protein LOC6544653 [Drosophila erecta]EDV52814.1 uncharacterized protein Dere_GG16658 [Drosophila erecta]